MSENYEALSREFKRLRTLHVVYLLVAVAALILYFVNNWACLGAMGVCLIYYFLKLRPTSVAYARSFVHVCAQASLSRYLTQAVHTHEPVLDAAQIRAALLMPANNTKSGITRHEGGTGLYHGCPVSLGDVTLTHSYTTQQGKTRHQFTNGLYMIVELGRESGLDCRVLFSNAAEEGSIRKMLRDNAGLERLDGGPGAGEDWSLIGANGKRALPGDKLMEAIARLDKATRGWAAVCVQGDKLHVYLIDRLLGQRVSSRYAPDASVEQADLIPELKEALKLADCI